MTSSFTPPKSYVAYAFLEKGGDLVRQEIPWKNPQQGQVIVKVLACGVCASDDAVKHGMFGMKYPRIPGHEIIGNVVAVGSGVNRLKVGQRVGGGWHGGHCFDCGNCRSGDFVTCSNEDINGISRDGGYAEYVALRAEAVAVIPDGLDAAEAAPLLCAGVTTFNSIRNMDVHPGDIAAVQGIGGLGHLAVQFASKMGLHTIALSSSDSKRELATQLGAAEYIDGSKENQAEALASRGGAKLIVCTAPSPKVIQGLLPGLAVGGQLLVLAVSEAAELPLMQLIQKRTSIRGWPSGTAKDSEDALKFYQQQKINCMVETFPLDKAQEAYDHRSNARFRAVIVPS